jgi:hypothetical protein
MCYILYLSVTYLLTLCRNTVFNSELVLASSLAIQWHCMNSEAGRTGLWMSSRGTQKAQLPSSLRSNSTDFLNTGQANHCFGHSASSLLSSQVTDNKSTYSCLDCNKMQSGKIMMFQRDTLPPSSGQKCKPGMKPVSTALLATCDLPVSCYHQEDHTAYHHHNFKSNSILLGLLRLLKNVEIK